MRKHIAYVFLISLLIIQAFTAPEIRAEEDIEFILPAVRRWQLMQMEKSERIDIIISHEQRMRVMQRKIARLERQVGRRDSRLQRLRSRIGFSRGVLITAGLFGSIIIVLVLLKVILIVKKVI